MADQTEAPAELLAFAERLADAAGAVIAPCFRKRLDVDLKADDSPVTRNNLGFCLTRVGDLDGAREQFEAALSVDPNNARAKEQLATLEQVAEGLTKAGLLS